MGRLVKQPGEAPLIPLGFFQLAIDPKLDPPDGKQIELGFGLARDDPLADAELPSPGARSDRRHGVFDALVNHIKIPPRAPNRFKSNLILKIVTINQYNYKLCSHVRLVRRLDRRRERRGAGTGNSPCEPQSGRQLARCVLQLAIDP